MRPYSRSERIADAIVHALGIPASLAACFVIATVATARGASARLAVALGLYAAGLLSMIGFSALYNLAKPGPGKALLQRFDHAAIFAMIAGTYTPVALLAIGGPWGWGLFAAIWTGAVCGAALKLLVPARVERASTAAYLLLAWAGLAALEPLLAALPPADLGLLAAGAILYNLGVVVHLSTRLPFHNAIWHALVLAAAACHFVLVLRLAAAS